ncbi:N-acetylneuraminate synthase [Verrucomicrobia bacterium]|nr:N-acetylneuraminate synthase [Verrucomicrobiota bacterium]
MKDRRQNSTLIIAEAGVNHNGCMETAIELVREAARAGADFVKFQTFTADSLVTEKAAKAEYASRTTDASESQHGMIRKLELNPEMHVRLIEECLNCGIEFASTAFDEASIEMLGQFEVSFLKVPSGELTNVPYLRRIASKGLPVILSTGMATLEEVREALDLLLASGVSKECVTILHCNTEYPTPMHDVNLRAMETIRKELGVAVGYSDHTLGIEIPIAAVAMGARVIEKHFTLDRSMPGPDHSASLEGNELAEMVSAIRNIEKAMGDGIKKPSPSEQKNITVVRKSIVAACSIQKGDEFTCQNLTVKRPGTGISPMRWDEIIGTSSSRDYNRDDFIKL